MITPPTYPHGNDPTVQEGLLHVYEKHQLPLCHKEAGVVQGHSVGTDRSRKKSASTIKCSVAESLRSLVEREHPVSGD